MRTPATLICFICLAVLIISSSYIHATDASDRSRWKRERAPVQFPSEDAGASLKSSWRIKEPDNGNSFDNHWNRKSKMQVPSDGMATRSWRKAEPDMQDRIISGIVHLLGGKVNLHTASGAEVTSPAGQNRPVQPQSTRINNRGPPRVTEVPFEAIPLELGNSAAGPWDNRRPQLPFGVPFRGPLWQPSITGSGQNLHNLPFASGIPLPHQLVPPVSNKPLPLPPNGIPLTLTAINATESPVNVTQEVPVDHEATESSDEISVSPSAADSPSAEVGPSATEVPEYSPVEESTAEVESSSHYEISSFSFFPEEASIVPTVSSDVIPTSSIVPEETTVPVESILQPSIEDVVSTLDQQPESSSVVVETLQSVDITSTVVVSSSAEATASFVPQLDAAYPLPSTTPSETYTPPLPDSRPGQVFEEDAPYGIRHHDADVITSDNIQPQGTYGETFELVVTANQNFGFPADSNPPPTGRPHVIPVDIDEVRQPTGLLTGDSSGGDQFVSIDGRKTYFNLFPTNAVEGIARPSQTAAVQPTAAPNRFPQGNKSGSGYVYPTSNGGLIRPQYPTRNPAYYPPAPQSQRPTPALIRRPSTTTPPGVIDACVVGDPNACLEPNESCRNEEEGAVCSCKPGYGRRKTSDSCKQLAGYLVSIRLDRWDNERLSWSPAYGQPENADFQLMRDESVKAIESLMDQTALSSVFVSTTVNKFYALNKRLVVNASVFLQQIPDTLHDSYRAELQKQMANAIQRRNNNVGLSHLFVDGPFNPIPAVQDLNECSSPDLNDCSADGLCFNAGGTYSCRCRPGYSDPFESDADKAGRQCNSCTPSYCNNRGECRIENGKKTCHCRGNYQGSTCELDGQVLGVAIGASLAAVIIIVLTLVFLCMWSRRWRQNQDKISTGFMEQLKTMPFPIMMQDRIRWAQYAEAMAATNLYAQPLAPPFYVPSTAPSIVHTTPPSSVIHSTVSPPPVPPRNKVPARQVASLPVDLTAAALTNQMVGAIQHLARRISRKKRPAPQPDPVNVNPNLALISPAYPVGSLTGTMTSRASMAPTLPLVGSFHRTRSPNGSMHSYGKRSAPPPPPSNPPPALPMIETSEESAAESDAPIARPFHVPRPRSRSSAANQNIYYEADYPSNEFSQSQLSLSTYNQRNAGHRRYYR